MICIATNPDLARLLQTQYDDEKEWASRCYFASLCMAILDVSLMRIHLEEVLALPILRVEADGQYGAHQLDTLHAGAPNREQELAWQVATFVRFTWQDGMVAPAAIAQQR